MLSTITRNVLNPQQVRVIAFCCLLTAHVAQRYKLASFVSQVFLGIPLHVLIVVLIVDECILRGKIHFPTSSHEILKSWRLSLSSK